MKNWKLALVASTILAVAQPVMAQTASPTGPWLPDQSLNSTAGFTPNWSGVRRTGPGCNSGAVTPLAFPYVNPLAPTVRGVNGQIATDQPLIARNFGTAPVSPDGVVIAPGALVMHPADEGQCSILRLTIPAGGGGTYAMSARFVGGYPLTENNGVSSGDGVRAMVLHNSVALGTVVETRNGAGTVQQQGLRLCPGDTLDFAVHMREAYSYDSTLLTGRVVRTGDNPVACPGGGGDGPIITHPTGSPTGLSGCCAPFSGLSILPSLQPMFPNGATGNYTMSYTAPAAMHAQMSAYLAYANSMDPSITTMTLSWQAANFGTGATPAASGPAIGGAQTVTWSRNSTTGAITVAPSTGGSFWTGAPFPVGSWIGFVTTLTHNGTADSIHFPQNCRVQWNAWRAQAAALRVGAAGGGNSVAFSTIGARGQVLEAPAVAVSAGQAVIVPANLWDGPRHFRN